MLRKTYVVSNFPAAKINALLGLEIDHTEVRVHGRLWPKIIKKHKASFSAVELYLDTCLIAPDYIGQAPHHFHNIEMIKRTEAGALLIAVKIRDDRSFYCRPIIASAYLIKNETLHNRIANKTLRRFK